jgi:hypothetical protein
MVTGLIKCAAASHPGSLMQWRGVGSKRELGATVLPMVVTAGFADDED